MLHLQNLGYLKRRGTKRKVEGPNVKIHGAGLLGSLCLYAVSFAAQRSKALGFETRVVEPRGLGCMVRKKLFDQRAPSPSQTMEPLDHLKTAKWQLRCLGGSGQAWRRPRRSQSQWFRQEEMTYSW